MSSHHILWEVYKTVSTLRTQTGGSLLTILISSEPTQVLDRSSVQHITVLLIYSKG